jgi:hypothetical protein
MKRTLLALTMLTGLAVVAAPAFTLLFARL